MKRYTYYSVTRQGRKDARDWKWGFWPFLRVPKTPTPKKNEKSQALFEKEIIDSAQYTLASLAKKWKDRDGKLKPDYCKASSIQAGAEKKLKKESEQAQSAVAELDSSKKKLEEMGMPSFHPQWATFWLILIGIAEFPLNSLVFAIFGSNRIETYIMASAMCIAIPLFAHFFGKALRQEIKTTIDKIILVGIPIIILGLLGGIAFIRAMYFESGSSLGLIGISISPQVLTILFMIINVALFFVATIIAYEASHPNHKTFMSVYKRHQEARGRLKKESGKAEKAFGDFEDAEKNLARIRQEREKAHEAFKQQAEEIKANREYLIAAYRRANIQLRNETPECFQKPPEIKIPEALINLDWDCRDKGVREPKP